MTSPKVKPRGAVGATLTGIANGWRRQEKIRPLMPEYRMEGLQVLVTGANSGLGLAIATDLAARGCRVVMGVRGEDDGPRQRIIAASGNKEVRRLPLDLASLASVRGFLARAAAEELTFQLVVINAAVVTAGARRTVDGLDEMFQVNFLSNVVLLEGLLGDGRIVSPSVERLPRIIVVNSEAHRWTESADLTGFGVYRELPVKQVLAHYSYTKFLMAGYVGCLTRRLTRRSGEVEISVFALCPGAVNSRLARNAPAFFKPLLKVIFPLFFASPKKAAQPVVYLAGTPELEGKTGVYLHMRNPKEMDPRALDPAFGEALTDATRELLAATASGARYDGGVS